MGRTIRRLASVFATLGVGLAVAAPMLPSLELSSAAAPGTATSSAPAAGDAFGDARDFGSMAGTPLTQPVVGIAATTSGAGYWLVARDGGIFSFGDAVFRGSTGDIRLNQPIVGITRTRSGGGYWFVAADGGVFSFGDAAFRGSTGAMRLNQPIVGMAATPTGNGYWLVAGDGGVFSFGDATSHGSAADRAASPVVGMAPSSGGDGYWLSTADGAVFAFGAAPPLGSAGTSAPVVGMAATPSGNGYWLATADGAVASAVGAAAAGGSFGFLRLDRDGDPVRYDPCAPVHYAINPAQAPPGAVDDVHEAFRRLGRATGITFVYDGATDEPHVPFGDRDTYQPERYGNRWVPILVSWAGPDIEALLAGATLGYGGSTSYWSGSSDEAFVTGEVVFDLDLSVLKSGFGGGLSRGNLILHELGHVIGLDHVDDRSQLMYPSVHSASPDGFASGDLSGLDQLGARMGCLAVAAPR